MKTLACFVVASLFFVSTTKAQSIRQQHLYLDDGSGNLIDFIAASLSGGRQLTIPDPGSNANFILSKSTAGQTITGGLTVSSLSISGGVSLPTNTGGSGDVLTSNGTGGSSWVSPTTSSGLSSFGYGFELATLADATVSGGADVPLSNNGPLSGVTHTAGTTTLTIPAAGTYEVAYTLSYSAGVGAEVAIAVNGTVDASTPIPLLTSTGQITGVSLLTLAAGDVLTLRNNSATALTMTLSPEVGAQITVKQLN